MDALVPGHTAIHRNTADFLGAILVGSVHCHYRIEQGADGDVPRTIAHFH